MRWLASENIAISEEEKNPESTMRTPMVTAPMIVIAVSVSSIPTNGTVYAGTSPADATLSSEPIQRRSFEFRWINSFLVGDWALSDSLSGHERVDPPAASQVP